MGNLAFQDTEGSKINQLEEDKLAQGDYFENMELWETPKARIYMDMDGVMTAQASVVTTPNEWKGKQLLLQ